MIMGHSNWSDAAFASRQADRKARKTNAFDYDTHVRSSGKVEIHPEMNIFGKDRESRDSDAHPQSLALGIIFDVTGSMGTVPRVLQTKLGALMRVLLQRGYVDDPQILFGAIGDAYCDRVPIQIGQFESGLEMDDNLGKIYIEGGGGGQVFESYELSLYYMAYHTKIDCYEKRGKKGYLFTIGDEKPYPYIQADQVRTHIGDEHVRAVDLESVLTELNRRYHHFHIIPTNTSHGKNSDIQELWRSLMQERILLLENADAVCETIALTIGLCEGSFASLASGSKDLHQAGADSQAVEDASTALQTYAKHAPKALSQVSGTLLALGNGTSNDDYDNDGRL
jgi:hypothetical protein